MRIFGVVSLAVLVTAIASPTLVVVRNEGTERVAVSVWTPAGTTRCELEPGGECWDVWLASWRDPCGNPEIVHTRGAGAPVTDGLAYRCRELPFDRYEIVCSDEAERPCAALFE